jgi:hypothetical protein
MTSSEDVELNYSPKQTEARDFLALPEVDELLLGGAKGGGKSVFGCQWMFEECYGIARTYFKYPPKEPVQVGWMGRKVAQDFRTTTLETWRRVVPSAFYIIKGRPEEIIIAGRIKILTGGLDSREEIEKFNSMELARVFLDQAEETQRDEVAALRGSFRLHLNGKLVKGKMLFTCNPRQCWLKDEFILNPDSNQRFLQSLYTDNPFIDQDDYGKRLDTAFGFRPELLRAYKAGDWNAVENPAQIIKSDWLEKARTRTILSNFVKTFLVCDTARFGDDLTVIYLMENAEIVQKVEMPYCRTTDISNRLATMSLQNNDCPIVVESIGSDIGAGVIDELYGLKRNVLQFNPAAAANNKEHYGNLRAEAWNEAAKKLSSGILDSYNNILLSTHNLD